MSRKTKNTATKGNAKVAGASSSKAQQGDALKTHKKGLMQRLFPSPDTQPTST